MKYVEPTSLHEAAAIVRDADGSGKYISGGTAVVLLTKMRMLAPEVLVSLRNLRDVSGWRGIESRGDALVIGGGVTLSEMAASPKVRHYSAGVAEAAAVVGNVRIRNAATIGGLLAEADYASDPPSALVAAGAEVLVSNGNDQRSLPVRDFLTDFFTTDLAEDEVVTGVRIPITQELTRSRYLKFSSRSAEDRPCVGVAASAACVDGVVTNLRVAVGATSAIPQCFTDVTDPFHGSSLQSSDIAAIAEAYAQRIDPIDDIRGTQWYRREVTRAQVGRALIAVTHGESQ